MSTGAAPSVIVHTSRILASRRWHSPYVCARCFQLGNRLKSDAADSNSQGQVAKRPRSRRERAARVSQSLADLANSTEEPQLSDSKDEATTRNVRGSANERDGATSMARVTEAARRSRLNQGDKGNLNPNRPVVFRRPSVTELLQSGQGTATIAAADFEGVVRDRLRLAMRPGAETPTFSHDRVVVNAVQRSEQEQNKQERPEPAKVPEEPEPRVKERYGQFLGKRFVAGDYDGTGVLQHKADGTNTMMSVVEKAMAKNATYLTKDKARFLLKAKGLMPATQTAPRQPPA